ncbi:NAD-dependent epimerase/dehydratase family protein [Kytococcus sp. Marseille-QA3725]
MTRVLVTGASGMLGGAVARALAERGDEVTVMQRRPSASGLREVLGSVDDPEAVARAVAGQEAVVHLAAKVDVVGPLEEFRRTNVEGTRLLLEAAREAGVERFVHTSSPSVAHAGAALVGVGSESAAPDSARGSYARTKAQAELMALAADGPQLAVTAVRPHLVWGPGDTQLVGRLVARARAGRLPWVGDGAALVDSTYVDNARDALVAALDALAGPRTEHSAHGRPWVVTNDEPRPVAELIAGIVLAHGAPLPRLRIATPPAGAAGHLVDAAVAASQRVRPITEPPLTHFLVEQLTTAHWFSQQEVHRALDWRPVVSLDEGLERLREGM